jgi:hypothetical protein
MVLKTVKYRQRVLVFDIENRPLSYWYDGQATAEVTAIAASYLGEDTIHCWLLGREELPSILEQFTKLYNLSDMVVGHYIRKHDLPIVNGALMEQKLPLLSPKLAHDTKLDLVKRGGLSMSQEALSAMYELSAPKHHMTQSAWRDANRLTPEGIKKTEKRVKDDVIQSKELYRTLLAHHALKQPKVWRP